jgi:microcystin degradation protein MlrC
MLSDGSFRNDGPMNAGVETSMGPTAVLRIGVDVVTISNRYQTIDLQVFALWASIPRPERAGGQERAAFPRAYGPIAREIVVVDPGASARLTSR